MPRTLPGRCEPRVESKHDVRFQCNICKKKKKRVCIFKREEVHFCKKALQAIVPKVPCKGPQERHYEPRKIEGTNRRGTGVVLEGGKMERSLAVEVATLREELELEKLKQQMKKKWFDDGLWRPRRNGCRKSKRVYASGVGHREEATPSGGSKYGKNSEGGCCPGTIEGQG